jgi:hypothetical protein
MTRFNSELVPCPYCTRLLDVKGLRTEDVQKETDTRTPLINLPLIAGLFVRRKTGLNMWQRNCPACQKLLEKKDPTETVQLRLL